MIALQRSRPGIDALPDMAKALAARIEDTFTPAALRMFEREFAFFDKVCAPTQPAAAAGVATSLTAGCAAR